MNGATPTGGGTVAPNPGASWHVIDSGDFNGDRQGAFVLNLLPHLFAVVGLIGRDSQRRSGRVQYLFDDLAVMDLPARPREAQRPAFAVDNRVDLCGPAAPTDTDRLIFLPPFSSARRAVSFPNGAINQIQTVARFRRQLVENAPPDPRARPPVEAIISRRVGAITCWQIPSRHSGAPNVKDRIHDFAIVSSRALSILR